MKIIIKCLLVLVVLILLQTQYVFSNDIKGASILTEKEAISKAIYFISTIEHKKFSEYIISIELSWNSDEYAVTFDDFKTSNFNNLETILVNKKTGQCRSLLKM